MLYYKYYIDYVTNKKTEILGKINLKNWAKYRYGIYTQENFFGEIPQEISQIFPKIHRKSRKNKTSRKFQNKINFQKLLYKKENLKKYFYIKIKMKSFLS